MERHVHVVCALWRDEHGHARRREHGARDGPRERRRAWISESAVFSFVGVLAITVVLFFVVAITGRLLLGR